MPEFGRRHWDNQVSHGLKIEPGFNLVRVQKDWLPVVQVEHVAAGAASEDGKDVTSPSVVLAVSYRPAMIIGLLSTRVIQCRCFLFGSVGCSPAHSQKPDAGTRQCLRFPGGAEARLVRRLLDLGVKNWFLSSPSVRPCASEVSGQRVSMR